MSAASKTVNTTLDKLPFGPEDSPHAHGKVTNPKIPDGVTNRMLIKDVLLIAWPSLVELILTQLTSMADQVMVGRLPGQEGIQALSAVGLAIQPKFLLMTMIQALNIGSTAVIARFRGQHNQDKAKQVLRQALMLNFVLSIFVMFFGLALAKPLIKLMAGSSISAGTVNAATTYFNIQLYGFIPLALSFTITAALRGIGNTRTPMIYNTVSNVVNLILNYLLIYGKFGFPRMGIEGAAWATIIGQTVAFIISVVTVLRKDCYLHLNLKERFKLDKVILGDVVKIGIPAMIEQLLMRIGIIVFTRTVASLGDVKYATHQVCMNVQTFSFMLGQAFANATTTLIGQSIGRRRYDMAEIYAKRTRMVGIILAAFIGVLFIVFRRTIIGLFNSTPDVIKWGSQVTILIACSLPIQTDQFIVSGGLRGAGDTKYAAVVIGVCVLGVRMCFGLLFVHVFNWGLWGAWIALMCDQLLRTFLMALRYNSGKWKELALENDIKGEVKA